MAPVLMDDDMASDNRIMNILIIEEIYDNKFERPCIIDFEALNKKVIVVPPILAAENL